MVILLQNVFDFDKYSLPKSCLHIEIIVEWDFKPDFKQISSVVPCLNKIIAISSLSNLNPTVLIYETKQIKLLAYLKTIQKIS